MGGVETVNIVLLGEAHELPAEEREPEISPHTGRQLRRVQASFSVLAEESAQVSHALAQAHDAEHALGGTDGVRWVVTNNWNSYQEGDRAHSYGVELQQVEDLQAVRIEFLDLVLHPKRYKEESYGEGGVFIVTRVEPDFETDEALERELTAERDDRYFDVLRIGVSDKPIRMRFGRCLWQTAAGGRAHLLRLVSEAGDDEEPLLDFRPEPELSNIAQKTLAAEEGLEALLNELQAGGTLSESGLLSVRKRMKSAWAKRARDLDESRDLDLHF